MQCLGNSKSVKMFNLYWQLDSLFGQALILTLLLAICVLPYKIKFCTLAVLVLELRPIYNSYCKTHFNGTSIW
jgi:hypothetical protein